MKLFGRPRLWCYAHPATLPEVKTCFRGSSNGSETLPGVGIAIGGWMAVPASSEARLYYRCAFQRQEDAQILLRADRTTGAVYLAGYGRECILKALVLSALTPIAGGDAQLLSRSTSARL